MPRAAARSNFAGKFSLVYVKATAVQHLAFDMLDEQYFQVQMPAQYEGDQVLCVQMVSHLWYAN